MFVPCTFLIYKHIYIFAPSVYVACSTTAISSPPFLPLFLLPASTPGRFCGLFTCVSSTPPGRSLLRMVITYFYHVCVSCLFVFSCRGQVGAATRRARATAAEISAATPTSARGSAFIRIPAKARELCCCLCVAPSSSGWKGGLISSHFRVSATQKRKCKDRSKMNTNAKGSSHIRS